MARSKIGKKDSHVFDAEIFALQYTGSLRESIRLHTQPPSYFSHSALPDSWNENIERQYLMALDAFKKQVGQERDAKLEKLAEHFQVDLERQEGWKMLALLLAVKHVPGFKVVTRKTRPTKWTPTAKFDFFLNVEHIRRRHRCGRKEALRIIAEQEVLKIPGIVSGSRTFSRKVSARRDTLNTNYSAFKRDKRLAEMWRSYQKKERLEQVEAAAGGKGSYLVTAYFFAHEIKDTRELFLRNPFVTWGPTLKVPQQ